MPREETAYSYAPLDFLRFLYLLLDLLLRHGQLLLKRSYLNR